MRMCLSLLLILAPAWSAAPPEWRSGAYREEIQPAFRFEEKGGKDGQGALVIETDQRAGLDGYWVKEYAVAARRWYRFTAWRRLENVPLPRRSANAEVFWLDDQGKIVPTDEAVAMQPDFLTDGETTADGWTEVSGAYRAPSRATKAALYLHLRWTTRATARWSAASVTELAGPPSRKVRLAAAQFKPRGGKSPAENCRMFAPLIEEAGRHRADLLVLGEILTAINNGYTSVQAAEPIPGPSTTYFGEMARKHNLYIVAGLLEREGHLVYNTAVLVGPDGTLAGKYRKMALPTAEVQGGVAPGDDYPVFETHFGKLGMMVCYDLFFPEVARQLANRGAEVIALPIYGGADFLGSARAMENHIYLVTSTYMAPADRWMRTGIFDHRGDLIATTSTEGTLALAEVDLEKKDVWPWLGHFRARIPRDRPEP